MMMMMMMMMTTMMIMIVMMLMRADDENGETSSDVFMMHCAPSDQLANVQRGSEPCLPASKGL